MSKFVTAVATLCVATGLAMPFQDPSITDWIRSTATKISSVQAGHGFADLQPLKRIIGNASIVSLGEATHGTREFFQLKHRMLEFLVTELGFNIFSIEASMPEAYRLNDYVLKGIGDPAVLLRGMYFWTWDTEEVLDMIRWIRAFNQSGKGRVQFTGFDMQTPTVAIQHLRVFADRVDKAILPRLDAAARDVTRAVQSVSKSSTGSASAPAGTEVDATAVIGEYKAFITHLEANRVRYRASGAGEAEIDWAVQHARLVLQGLEMRAKAVPRDYAMAQNVKWILDRNPGSRIVLWSHNLHAAAGGVGFQSMGASLRQMFGRAMVVFGFAFNQGSFQAIQIGAGRLRSFTVPPLSSPSLDTTLASVGWPMFALDLRDAPRWFREPRVSREIGSVYPDGVSDAFAMNIVAAEAFDALLFVESTTAARPNRRQ